ncbi:uncharacterized protein EDB93DRAFT_1251951 [Suillus bovinus]|uniref:uncharacterized protein n=1 Tax=Suillus bovinus TaxID=48563 RepID=UPI001B86A32A|nr:uncharacterized protein EDB93DRAFT_1251951 [Suillus bovinus]KAG2143535.1 hypothetical protein EDB93DRAFT_1251951 [Suillus bovinus]
MLKLRRSQRLGASIYTVSALDYYEGKNLLWTISVPTSTGPSPFLPLLTHPLRSYLLFGIPTLSVLGIFGRRQYRPLPLLHRIACIRGHLSIAEELLTQDINTSDIHTSYAHRSFVLARKHDWERALQDAIQSITTQPSLIGYISKGIALYISHFLLLIKAIAFFSANQYDEASLLLKELTTGCPNADTRACHIVQAYLRVELRSKALDSMCYDEAADHFTAAVDSGALSSTSDIHEIYEDLIVSLVQLFGWDLKSVWLTVHQKRCHALLWAGKLNDAMASYRYMMDNIDETTKVSCLECINGKSRVRNAFKQECSAFCTVNGDAALAANDYDRAIDLYSVVIDLYSASDTVFANRSKGKLEKMLWEDALLDAQKVAELNPSSHIAYQLTHAALRGMQRYDEAIEAFKMMLSKLDDSPEVQIQGVLCDRPAQINAFRRSIEYKDLLSSTTKQSDLKTERIKDAVATYFRCVLLSHRWEEAEALLHDIQGRVVYELNGIGGIEKLQSFCKIVRDAGYYWAWMDTCCIDKRSNTELQESVNSMFVWYRHSALTIVYLSDVLPSSEPGALARSVWNKRGWTFQELVAPKVVIFYQKDWSLYLGDCSSNHKESPAIMRDLKDATGIDAQALLSFHPGMSDARQRLQWASSRITTLQEDIAYSLFGIFDLHLPVIYGERKQNALGRLLQEIVAQSGDITALDWVGQSSGFNSCLPADLTSYNTPPHALPSLPENQIQTTISALRTNTMVVDLALNLYDQLDNNTSAARFANRRLHLPFITFRVTDISLSYEPIVSFSHTRSTQTTFVLVRPWDRSLLELPDFADLPHVGDTENESDYWTPPSSPSDESPRRSLVNEEVVDLESRALRLLVRLGQPFAAFLLARQCGGEYKRVASEADIIVQVKDIGSVQDLMDIRTIEIL